MPDSAPYLGGLQGHGDGLKKRKSIALFCKWPTFMYQTVLEHSRRIHACKI